MTPAEALSAVRNPLAFIAARWTPTPRTVRRAALAALVMSVVIVVTGGAVRLTGSGLGCPTWPKCTDDSLTTTSAMGVHGVIEFTNRMLTYVLCAAVGWAIVAARSEKPLPPQPDPARLGAVLGRHEQRGAGRHRRPGRPQPVHGRGPLPARPRP